jgi:hypothetical protein
VCFVRSTPATPVDINRTLRTSPCGGRDDARTGYYRARNTIRAAARRRGLPAVARHLRAGPEVQGRAVTIGASAVPPRGPCSPRARQPGRPRSVAWARRTRLRSSTTTRVKDEPRSGISSAHRRCSRRYCRDEHGCGLRSVQRDSHSSGVAYEAVLAHLRQSSGERDLNLSLCLRAQGDRTAALVELAESTWGTESPAGAAFPAYRQDRGVAPRFAALCAG